MAIKLISPFERGIEDDRKSWGYNWEFVAKNTYFNWLQLYKWLHNYLKVEGWEDIQLGKDRYETFLQEIDMGGGAKNQWVYWRASKKPENEGGAGYMRIFFALNVQVLFTKLEEKMHKGQKVKLNSGEFKFVARVWFSQEADAGDPNKSFWNTNKFLSFLKKKFWRRINARVYDEVKAETIKHAEEIYEYLQVYTGVLPDTGKRGFWIKDKGKEF